MADNIYDLRKYHINTIEDANKFLELVEARIPEIAKVVRKQSLVEASLRNRLSAAENRPSPVSVISDVSENKNESVLTTLTGANSATVKPDASRLTQMKQAAGNDPEKQAQIKRAAAAVSQGRLPSALDLVGPGEIGQLNVETPLTTTEQEDVQDILEATTTSQEEADKAAGSPSELAPDQGTESKDETVNDNRPAPKSKPKAKK